MDAPADLDARLTRGAASHAVEGTGWRYVLDELRASVPVGTLADAVRVADTAVTACGEWADGHLDRDPR